MYSTEGCKKTHYEYSSGSRGGRGGHGPPGPVKIGHKKDGCRRQPHRFHVSWPPLTQLLDPLLEYTLAEANMH